MLSQRLVVYMYVLKKRNGSKSNVKKKKSLLCIYEKNKNKKQRNPGKINLSSSFFVFFFYKHKFDFCPNSEKIEVNKKNCIHFFYINNTSKQTN
jgi:hypothetical protein